MNGASHIFYRNPNTAYPICDHAEGVWIWDRQGNRYLDGSSGACVVSIGHGVREITDAARKQMEKVSFAHGSQFTTEATEEMADRVSRLADDPQLSWVYFVSGGSEAVETSVKMARQYWREKGKNDRYKIISRWSSYHGNTSGALALGGYTKRQSPYSPMIQHTPHIAPCYCYRCPFRSDSDKCEVTCAEELDRIIHFEGPDSIAAFIAEPVVGATAGAVVPHEKYWKRIRQICDENDILLIADEVMTGVGRTGKPLAISHWGITPDIVVLAKGLTSGYAPVGAVLVHQNIHNVIKEGSGAFVHGHTYGQHPVSMAIGSAVLEHIEKKDLFNKSMQMGSVLMDALKPLEELEHVGDVRGLGLLRGVEFVKDKETGKPYPAEQQIAAKVGAAAFKRGLVTYPGSGGADGICGDHVLICPPFVIENEEVELLAATLREAIVEVTCD